MTEKHGIKFVRIMKTTTFNIIGMHCASCVVRNERALKKVKGVHSASVNFGTHSATVELDEKVVDEKTPTLPMSRVC